MVEQEGWANEFRPIAGWYNGHWLFDINPIFGYALSGPDRLRPDFGPAGKVGFNIQHGFMLGAEYYAGLGYLSSLPAPRSEQDHLMLLTFDLADPVSAGTPTTAGAEEQEVSWQLNVGLGRALSNATPQQWILKVIFGKAF